MAWVEWNRETVRDRCEEVGECWVWQQAVNSRGYPQACMDGKGGYMVRRWVYENLKGYKLRPKHVVTSTCRNRACCNPSHLRQVTMSESLALAHQFGERRANNAATKRNAGMKAGIYKLNMEIAREIRASFGLSNQELAEKFGISKLHVSAIKNNRCWKESVQGNSVFNWRP